MEIKCTEVLRDLSNYVDGDVHPELRAPMEDHLKECAHCTAVLEGIRNVVKLLGNGLEYEPPGGFSQRLFNKGKNKDKKE